MALRAGSPLSFEDIPPHFRAWTLADYDPRGVAALEPFLMLQRWCVYLFGGVGSRKTSVAAALLKAFRAKYAASSDGRWGEFVEPGKLKA